MKKVFQLFFITLIITTLGIQKINAQNIYVALKSIKSTYENEMTEDFKISFLGGTSEVKKDIGLKYGESSAQLKQSADLTTFEIKFTYSDGTLSTLDKDGKPVKISGNKFKITIGDDLNFDVVKPNVLLIDVSNIKDKYEADLSRDLKISVQNGKAKQRVSIVSKAGVESLLNSQANLKNFAINFINKNGLLITKNTKGVDVKINTKELPFTIIFGDNKINIAAPKADVVKIAQKVTVKDEKEKIPYWINLKDNSLAFSLEDKMILSSASPNCCDDCESCDDNSFLGNNRIIYNAKSGVTYFLPADEDISDKLCSKESIDNYKKFRVTGKNKIKLNAGDPLVYIVENVNPALYNLELSDSAFLTNNESNSLLESLLLSKSENAVSISGDGTKINGGDDEKNKKENEDEYLKIKTGLIIVKAEMIRLLENLRRSSPYLHNCIQVKKREALAKINAYPSQILKYDSKVDTYKGYSFIEMVDVFLNQETEDSTLNHQIKALYGEFMAASYKIAYRYPQIPEQDILNFKLSIVAKPNSPYPSLLNVKMKDPTQTVYVKNFLKVDVSSGLYMGFMKDQTYALQADTLSVRNAGNTRDSLTNIKRIVKEDDGKNEIGFASFLHLYYKFSNWFHVGGTLGAGISYDKTVRPRYFTGLSLLLGSNNRICINGGVVWGNYEDISNQYKKTDANYNVLKDTETSINYSTKFKNAAFISISYNLPFLKRKTDAKPKDNTSPSTTTSSSSNK